MTGLDFVKMEGCGNDYIMINCFTPNGAVFIDHPNQVALIQKMSDRHFGVGGDGVILVRPANVDGVVARMQMFNADGSEAEMCGNGLRIAAKLAYDCKIVGPETNFPFQTGAGVLHVTVQLDAHGKVSTCCVNMGTPRLLALTDGKYQDTNGKLCISDLTLPFKAHSVTVLDRTFDLVAISMGNPHCVVFLDEGESVKDFALEKYGSVLETHPLFPHRVNVEFVERHSASVFSQRTWERGSGETLACGTGASAVCVAVCLRQMGEEKILIHLRGGDLQLHLAADGFVYKTGPAVTVFEGTYPSI